MGWRFFNYESIKDRNTDRCQLLKSESPWEKGIFANWFYTPSQSQQLVQNEAHCTQWTLIFYLVMRWVQQPILPGSTKILLSLFICFQVYEEISIKFWFSIGFLQWDDMLIKHTLTFPGKVFLIVNFKFSFWV